MVIFILSKSENNNSIRNNHNDNNISSNYNSNSEC